VTLLIIFDWEIIEYGVDKNARSILRAGNLDQKNHFFGGNEREEMINSMKDMITDLILMFSEV